MTQHIQWNKTLSTEGLAALQQPGGVIVCPTKVGYIIMATDKAGLERKFDAKERKRNKPGVVPCVAVARWFGAFDAAYGSQDEAFDRSEGLHSLATQFTAHGALVICRFVHAASIACFYGLGILMELQWPYFIGVGVAAGTLAYQHRIVRADDYSRVTQRYFMRNGIVSIAMLIFTVASLYV